MVAEMNKIERAAARLAMGDLGSELVVKSTAHVSIIMKIGFVIAAVAVTGLIAANLF
jgi:hypothetical protein